MLEDAFPGTRRMSAEHLLDTNIFVYSFDHTVPEKRDIARDLIESSLESRRGAVSTQVIQEFLNLATRKFKVPLSPDMARTYVQDVLEPICLVTTTVELLQRALGIHERWKFGYYDSLIVAAALTAGCHTLYTEDLQSGQVIEGLDVVNPFGQVTD